MPALEQNTNVKSTLCRGSNTGTPKTVIYLPATMKGGVSAFAQNVIISISFGIQVHELDFL